MKRLSISLIVAVAALAAMPAAAQQARMVRGVVSQIQPDRITVAAKGGKPVVVELSKDWRASVTKPIDVADIKPGSFIGSAEMPTSDGVGRSLEVHVFPPGVKMGEGHYAWDKKKGSMMTNGTVGNITVSKGGRELEVSYPGGQRKVVVPRNVPIVQITGGDRSLVKRGATVFIVAAPKPGGGLITNAVAVGQAGSRPPM